MVSTASLTAVLTGRKLRLTLEVASGSSVTDEAFTVYAEAAPDSRYLLTLRGALPVLVMVKVVVLV